MPTYPSTRIRARSRPPAAVQRWTGIAALGIAVLLVAGCAPVPAPVSDAPSRSGTVGLPVTVENCGTEVTFDAPPERVVTIKSNTLELLLTLGLQDRIVGTAFSDGPLPEGLAPMGATLPVLSDKVPSQEVVLASEPDLVFAGWESNLTADGAGDRATLAGLGVASYVAPAACKTQGYMPDPLTFNEVFREFEEVGRIFGVPDRAAELVSAQRRQLEATVPDDRGLTAVWYSSGTDIPYVGAGIGAPQMVMEAAGLVNIAGDVHDSWTSLGWESVVAAEPDVIVLVDAAWNTAEAKIALLESNPVTAALPAVREGRYVTVDFPATEAGVRNVDAVTSLVDQLASIDVP